MAGIEIENYDHGLVECRRRQLAKYSTYYTEREPNGAPMTANLTNLTNTPYTSKYLPSVAL